MEINDSFYNRIRVCIKCCGVVSCTHTNVHHSFIHPNFRCCKEKRESEPSHLWCQVFFLTFSSFFFLFNYGFNLFSSHVVSIFAPPLVLPLDFQSFQPTWFNSSQGNQPDCPFVSLFNSFWMTFSPPTRQRRCYASKLTRMRGIARVVNEVCMHLMKCRVYSMRWTRVDK